jgi:hypothetical protein
MTRQPKEGVPTRVRRILKDEVLKLRALQMAGGIKSSELFKIIASVFRETEGESVNVFLIYVIRQLEADERRN